MTSKSGPYDTSVKRVATNTVWNLFGQSVPLLAAFFSIPILIDGLGKERFGLLSMVWMMIGYFSLFDLGLGRALTLIVSEKLGLDQEQEIPGVVITALVAMLMLGVFACGLMLLSSEWLAAQLLSVEPAHQAEAVESICLLALITPIVIVTVGLRGVLESYQRFDLINMVRVPLGLMTFLVPVVVLQFENSLTSIVLVLMLVRVVAFFIHVSLCWIVIPRQSSWPRISGRYLMDMFSFGGWMTVTNIIGPFMIYLDRFMIGGVLGLLSVTYYVTPYELISKLWIIPGAITGVLFPAFSSALVVDRPNAALLFRTGFRWVLLSLFVPTFVCSVYAREILGLWLSQDFVLHSAGVLQVLSLGILLNGLALVPFTYIQADGRPDVTAKFHIIELPIYLIGLYFSMVNFGLMGVGVAWTVRVGLDALILFAFVATKDRSLRPRADQFGGFLLMVLPLALAGWVDDLRFRLVFGCIYMAIFMIVGWFTLLAITEREFILKRVRGLSGLDNFVE